MGSPDSNSATVSRDERAQTTTEYILILFLAVSIFSYVAKTLGPVLRKAAKNQAEKIEKQFSQGLYRFRIPGR